MEKQQALSEVRHPTERLADGACRCASTRGVKLGYGGWRQESTLSLPTRRAHALPPECCRCQTSGWVPTVAQDGCGAVGDCVSRHWEHGACLARHPHCKLDWAAWLVWQLEASTTRQIESMRSSAAAEARAAMRDEMEQQVKSASRRAETAATELKKEALLRKKAYNEIRALKGNIRVCARVRCGRRHAFFHTFSKSFWLEVML